MYIQKILIKINIKIIQQYKKKFEGKEKVDMHK